MPERSSTAPVRSVATDALRRHVEPTASPDQSGCVGFETPRHTNSLPHRLIGALMRLTVRGRVVAAALIFTAAVLVGFLTAHLGVPVYMETIR